MPIHWKSCGQCGVGSIIPRWQNITKARPAGDTGGTHYTATPYPRFDTSIYNTENPGAGCRTLPAGSCGNWLVGGDLNGLSIQEIEDTVDDIMACATPDATHNTTDHNCYFKNGDTVDRRATKLFGGQWVLAPKNWQGCFGWNSNDVCAKDPNIEPDQTKYLTATVDANLSYTTDNFLGRDHTVNTGSATGAITVGRLTGIINSTLLTVEDHYYQVDSTTPTPILHLRHIAGGAGFQLNSDGTPLYTYLSGASTCMDGTSGCDAHCTGSPPLPLLQIGNCMTPTVRSAVDCWNASAGSDPTLGIVITSLPAVVSEDSYAGTATDTRSDYVETIAISWERTETSYSWGVTLTRVPADPAQLSKNYSFSGTLTLSDAYTSADCYADFKSALALDMSDLNLAALRTDETLALAPLCLFDEVGPTSPVAGFIPATMDDYSATQNGDGSWPQRAWLDSSNYIWKYPNGSYATPTGFTGGATLITPMRTGAIIAHTQPGSDRHFWFGYAKMKRAVDPANGYYEWFNDTHGAFSEAPLPAVTMRWMDNEEAQYDGTAFRNGLNPHPGNYPQAFWNQQNGVIRGAKFVMASQRWPSVNFGRACGADKYAVDQPTVCCITGGSAGAGFTVKKTGNALAPLTAGGLAVNDYIIVEADGIYKISGITDNGTADWASTGDPYQQFTVTVGSKLDDLPTGCNFSGGTIDTVSTSPTGVLTSTTDPANANNTLVTVDLTANGNTINGVNFILTIGSNTFDMGTVASAPYQVSIKTTIFNSGTMGFNILFKSSTSASAGSFLGRLRFPTASGICGRAAITTAYASGTVTITPAIAQPWLRLDPTTGTLLVDVYDSSMTLVALALSLTRVSDTSFTITPAAMPTAAWMTGAGVDWTKYDAAPKKTGVHLEWSFNQRALDSRYLSPPTWYGGIGGCLACSVAQFTYSSGACPSAIGIVPFYPVPANTSGELPDQNSQPPGNEPVEQFSNQEMFDFPATVIFDDVFGAHWQAAVMLTMPDPFWQQPFKPDCFIVSPAAMRWNQDDGTGQADTEEITAGGATVYHRWFEHHPLVEALANIPSGRTLPAGVSLLYDPTVNVIAPPYYPTGIPIADNAGNYAGVEMDWGFTLRACGNVGGRFRTEYNFVTC